MNPRVIKRLEDAIDACERVQVFLKGISRETFFHSELLRSAVERQLEIIGEALNAASKQEESLVEMIPDLPRIVGMRNRLIHGYDSVDAEIVWDIANHNVPSLLEQLRGGLSRFGI
jgi:uncharacterized protein with HEPN domain